MLLPFPSYVSIPVGLPLLNGLVSCIPLLLNSITFLFTTLLFWSPTAHRENKEEEAV